jgi:hypothetical protein
MNPEIKKPRPIPVDAPFVFSDISTPCENVL